MSSARKAPFPPRLALAVAVLAVSSAAVFVLRADAPKLALATYRCLIATPVLALFGARACAREWPGLTRRDAWIAVATGLCLAVHFATWISSLAYTSVASSTVIVNTTPLWVALLAPFLSSDRIGRRTLSAISLCVVGCVVIGAGDLRVSGSALKGDGLALIGALTCALYLIAGRRLRSKLSLLPYVIACYGTAAVCLLVFAFATGTRLTGFDGGTWCAIAGLALVPQLIGHSSYNYALRYVSAATTSVVALGETVGATLLAWWLLGQEPSAATVIGGVIVLSGVVIALRGERAST